MSIEFLSGDVKKTKFLKLWDLLGYFKRITSERPSCQTLTLCQGRIVSEILVPFCSDDSTNPSKFNSVPNNVTGIISKTFCPDMLIFGE